MTHPFLAGPVLKNNAPSFVGRQEPLKFLKKRMQGLQPISVNVTGGKKIGKSSLLVRFVETWEQRLDEPEKFIVVFVDVVDLKDLLHKF